MAICDHQFKGGDESDWILSTSASCLDGSTTASRILQELFNRKHIQSLPYKNSRKRPKAVPKPKPETDRCEAEKQNETLIVKKISGTYSFDDFDESQHLNGCPMKWLHNKKLLEKNKVYKIGRLCSNKPAKEKDAKTEKCKNLRDKTPLEVKIHKINLIEKYTRNCDEMYSPYNSYPSEKSEKDTKELETHRKKLAAKLNWKLHDESQDGTFEPPPDTSFRHNYLPPRPLIGLKPLLSVLLATHQESRYCSFVSVEDPSKKKKAEPSLSIQSLDLPLSPAESKPRPNTTNTLRWGSKSSVLSKKFQVPNQITIKLEGQIKPAGTPENQLKMFYGGLPMKKSTDKLKQTKSLSSLFYELKDKTSYRTQNEKRFENLIGSLSMEAGQFQMKRFFNITSASSDIESRCKISPEKRKKLMETLTSSELNLVCEKVRFFKKKSSKSEKKGFSY